MNNRIYGVAIAVILIFLAIITLFIYVNWNPSPKLNVIPFGLSFPDLPGYYTEQTGLLISMMITYNGTMAENMPIQVIDPACEIASSNFSNVWTVAVGFQEAIPWDFRDAFQHGGFYVGGVGGAFFRNTNNSAYLSASEEEFYFPVSGDFSPTIFITFFNGTSVSYTYSEMKLHVSSTSEVNAENTNRNSLVLTIALLGFSYIEGFMMIKELLEKRALKTQSEANNANTPPKT
jgi:hypothetical protein